MTRVSIPETVLIFVGAPAAAIALITVAVFGPSELKTTGRYRPGRPWPHSPAWFVPHPSVLPSVDHAAHAALPSGHSAGVARELPGSTVPADDHAADLLAPVGGASGEW